MVNNRRNRVGKLGGNRNVTGEQRGRNRRRPPAVESSGEKDQNEVVEQPRRRRFDRLQSDGDQQHVGQQVGDLSESSERRV